MANFAEKKAEPSVPVEKAREEHAPELSSRVIRRGPSELYGAIDALSGARENRELGRHSEGTFHSVKTAEHATRVAANVQEHLGEGTAPLHERFIRMLQSMM
jgi:hypothetical protein